MITDLRSARRVQCVAVGKSSEYLSTKVRTFKKPAKALIRLHVTCAKATEINEFYDYLRTTQGRIIKVATLIH